MTCHSGEHDSQAVRVTSISRFLYALRHATLSVIAYSIPSISQDAQMSRAHEFVSFRQCMEDFISSVDLVATTRRKDYTPLASRRAILVQKRLRKSNIQRRHLQEKTLRRPDSHLAKDVLTANDYRLCRAYLQPGQCYEPEKLYDLTMLALL